MNPPNKIAMPAVSTTAVTATSKHTIQQRNRAPLGTSSVGYGQIDGVVGAEAADDEVGVAGSKLAQVMNGRLIQITVKNVGRSSPWNPFPGLFKRDLTAPRSQKSTHRCQMRSRMHRCIMGIRTQRAHCM